MIPSNFKNPAMIDLIRSIRLETQGEDRCLISRLRLTQRNMVVLPCNHRFHIDYYSSVRKKHRCPYCNMEYDPLNLEKVCSVKEDGGSQCAEITPIVNGICKKHNKPVCIFKITRGKNKDKLCGKKCEPHSDYCVRHKEKQL